MRMYRRNSHKAQAKLRMPSENNRDRRRLQPEKFTGIYANSVTQLILLWYGKTGGIFE